MHIDNRVEYGMGKNVLAFFGIIAGAGIAIGLPTITLIYGAGLPTWLHATVFILSLLVGGVVAGISAFFGMVLPKFAGQAPAVNATVERDPDGGGSAGKTQGASMPPQTPSK